MATVAIVEYKLDWPCEFERIAATLRDALGGLAKMYADMKDPICDLIMVAAEAWAKASAWNLRR